MEIDSEKVAYLTNNVFSELFLYGDTYKNNSEYQ